MLSRGVRPSSLLASPARLQEYGVSGVVRRTKPEGGGQSIVELGNGGPIDPRPMSEIIK